MALRIRIREKKQAMRRAQNNICCVCGARFGSGKPTFEHVVPKSQGGKRHGNLLLSHYDCNFHRRDAKPTGCMLIMLAAVNARLGIAA